MPIDIDAQLPVEITLTARDWIIIRSVLAKGPYDIVQPLVDALTSHLEAAATTAIRPPNGNGELIPEIQPDTLGKPLPPPMRSEMRP